MELESKIKRSTLEKILDIVALVVFISVVIYYAVLWKDLPAEVPSHFNGKGEVDGWGGKGSMLPLPIIGILLWLGIGVLEKFPGIYNYPFEVTEENRERLSRNSIMMVNVFKNELLLFMSYMTWLGLQVARGNMQTASLLNVYIYIGIFLGSMAFFIYRMYKLR